MTLLEILKSPSKTLASALAVFCFGVVLGLFFPFGWWSWLLGFATGFLIAGIFFPHREWRFIFILFALFFFSLFRSTYALSPIISSVASVPSSAIRVEGRVDAQVEQRTDSQRVVLDHVHYADDTREGKLLMWAPLYPEIQFGDTVVFNCRVEQPKPFNGFAYDRSLAIKGIFAVCYQPLYIDVHPSTQWSVIGSLLLFKNKLIEHLQEFIPEPHAAFLVGLVFGGSSALSPDLKQDFTQTGLSHVLAASGFNISLFSVTFLSFILSTGIGRRRGLVLTLVLLCVYVVLAGASAAVVRAGIMGSLIVVERWVSRKAYLLNLFLLTASVMLFVNPLLFFDVGFQLSFVATVAVIVFAKPLSEHLEFLPELFGLRESFAASLAAIFLTLPLILWHFGQMSLVAPFANILVLPLVPYAMALTLVGVFVAFFFGGFAQLILLPAWALSCVMLTVVNLFGSLSFASIEPIHSRLLAIIVAFSFFLFWFYRRYVSRET
ncbi:MAG: ComEC/Rec2-related protein [Candidatus Uhrbacteria bacterium GW2011_GWF2_39_13]|uniref:ComEC/Rec2-related protein n=1 Tax=Candidatus Uhrbacteria bacterium GW2011_GWF2_39_13 TaxID=1618995 RepID=A0A0G0MM19_9BACT|nr:MAG: ComEC/Rec2-related protein [Candidatus Uhrbacteria bacterium GW2011_GWF2_39_13]HAU66669.1 hypothetical protein [Candidatus Uhrbacteria bacterium]